MALGKERCKISVYSIREKSGATLLGRQNCHPWAVSIVQSNIENKIARIKIAPGSINNVVPSNITQEFEVKTDGTVYYIYCSVESSNGSVQSCRIQVSSQAPSGFGLSELIPPTSFEVFIGSFCNGEYFVTKDNISIQVYEVFKQSRGPNFPGDRPYDIYYSWRKV